MTQPRQILLIHQRAPGDTVVMTALVRDIAAAYPGKFRIAVQTNAQELWKHNPHIVPAPPKPVGWEHIQLDYGAGITDQKYEPVHFLSYFHRDFERKAKVRVPVGLPYPDLHLGPDEQQPLIQGRYWVLLAGGKRDFTTKIWEAEKFQAVVRDLRLLGLRVVQVGGRHAHHIQPALTDVLDWVGKTSLREMMRIIRHADGVICPITCAMHMAAAFQRPCVTLAGGREAWWWEAYVRQNKGLPHADQLAVPHKYLHTIGLLGCCETHGCWRNKVVKINNDKSLCFQPVYKVRQTVPKCLDLITASHVVEAVMQYYRDGTLPPIDVDPAELVVLPATPRPPGAARELSPGTAASPIPVVLSPPHHITPQRMAEAATRQPSPLDDPLLGGCLTFCVHLRGGPERSDQHHRVLSNLLGTVPAERRELFVGTSGAGGRTLDMLQELQRRGELTRHVALPAQTGSYQVMQALFQLPCATRWVWWFEDDALVRDPEWLKKFGALILQAPVAQFVGLPQTARLPAAIWKLWSQRSWHKHRPARTARGPAAPNGDIAHFPHPSCWAATAAAIRTCCVPDLATGLPAATMAAQLGEQFYQGGCELQAFNRQRELILLPIP